MADTTEALALGGYDQRPELDCPTGADVLEAFAEPANLEPSGTTLYKMLFGGLA